MRLTFLFFLSIYYFVAIGQKLEYRNDSLFVNNYYVDAQTSKITLDSLLHSKSKTKISKSSFITNPTTGKKATETTDFYYNLGLYFRKYDHDTNRLSISIKLYRDTDEKKERKGELTETSKGQLFIANNYINDKRTIDQLHQLKNCTVTISKASLGSYSTIIGGDILYQQSVIRLTFDGQTNELTSVYIHHNLKDR